MVLHACERTAVGWPATPSDDTLACQEDTRRHATLRGPYTQELLMMCRFFTVPGVPRRNGYPPPSTIETVDVRAGVALAGGVEERRGGAAARSQGHLEHGVADRQRRPVVALQTVSVPVVAHVRRDDVHVGVLDDHRATAHRVSADAEALGNAGDAHVAGRVPTDHDRRQVGVTGHLPRRPGDGGVLDREPVEAGVALVVDDPPRISTRRIVTLGARTRRSPLVMRRSWITAPAVVTV